MSEESWAQISEDERYRYLLGRRWSAEGSRDAWIMLNPSTADATVNDRTICRCMAFSRGWGAGVMVVVNLFALRSTDPAALVGHPDPVGPENDAMIQRVARAADRVICAWGAHPEARRRAGEVGRLIPEGVPLFSLGLTKTGAPPHPLYLRSDTGLTPWRTR